MQRLSLILALAVLCACGGTCGGSASTTSQPSPVACVDSGVASQSWPLPQPPLSPTPTIVSATVSGDTLTFAFVSGTPPFQVVTQQTTEFAQEESGKRINLPGTNGARIVLTGFRGDQIDYTGPKTLTSSGPRLLQVVELGDFEDRVSWAVGLSEADCATVTATASTLAFHFIPDV